MGALNLRFTPPPDVMTPRGIKDLENRIRRQLPAILHEVLEVDVRRHLISVLEVRVTPDRRRVRAWLGFRFLPKRTKFCCMEPGCHMGRLVSQTTQDEAAARLARRVGLPASVELRIEDTVPMTEGAGFMTMPELEELGDAQSESMWREELES